MTTGGKAAHHSISLLYLGYCASVQPYHFHSNVRAALKYLPLYRLDYRKVGVHAVVELVRKDFVGRVELELSLTVWIRVY